MVEHASNIPNPNNLDSFTRKPGPLSPEQKLKRQIRFIKVFRETANIKYSCQKAGISRQTYYEWQEHDPIFAAHLVTAGEEANDALEQAAHDRAVNGVPSYVVSQGRIVYEDIPVLEKDGTPKLDVHGKQVYLHGKPLIERKYSDTLLVTLLKARMPQKYNRQQLEVSGPDGKPIQHQLVTELAKLPPEQLDLLEQASRIVDEAVKHGS